MGDTVTLRLPKAEDIPADSPLGEKTDRIRSFPRLKVIEIIPAAGLGQFSLTPRQTLPANAYVSLEQLQDGLQQPVASTASWSLEDLAITRPARRPVRLWRPHCIRHWRIWA